MKTGEATGNLCLGSRGRVQERVGSFLIGLAGRKEEVKRRCRTLLPIKGRHPAARLPHRLSTPRKCTSHFGFGLGSLSDIKENQHS